MLACVVLQQAGADGVEVTIVEYPTVIPYVVHCGLFALQINCVRERVYRLCG